MVQLASEIVLNDVDVEFTLLGSVLSEPDAFALVADQLRPEWFSDQFLRYMLEAAQRLHNEGHRLSPAVVVASLPEDCGGLTRGQFYARACASGMPLASVGGLVHVVKDRWARRELIATADVMKAAAVRFDADPYELAGDGVMMLDSINADRDAKRGGSLDTAMQALDTALVDVDKLKGATTGLQSLDAKLNGYKAGQLYVIAGRPGMGKSAFMCSSLRRTAQAGHGVMIFSLEMTEQEIAARCMADALDSLKAPFFGNILKGLIADYERDDLRMASDSLSGIPLYINDAPRLTFSEIIGKARQEKAKWDAKGTPLNVICIDHMGLVTPSDRYRGNKVAEAGEISSQARSLAKELNCCVVLLCQLSREVEKRDEKRPVMSDLRWSGEIEQDAHVVAFLYRESYYLAQDANADPYMLQDAKHKLEFLIRKNRNGETDDVRLWCSIGHSSVRDQ